MSGRQNALLKQLADLDDPTPKDFDPEDEVPIASDDESGHDSASEEENAGRDHYVSVGKSKLRRPTVPSLGPQYVGSQVSRDGLVVEEEDDPFARSYGDAASDEDDSQGEVSGSGSVDEDVGGEGGSSDEMMSENDEDEEGGQGTPNTGDDDSASLQDFDSAQEAIVKPAKASGAALAEARAIMAREQQSVATRISKAIKDDAEKGRAVKKQRTTFDSLLNTRIKLQKALIGSNTLAGLARDSKIEDVNGDLETACRSAEAAAFALWDSVSSIRDTLQAARSGNKRSQSEYSVDSNITDLWERTQTQDSLARPFRDSILDKWYAKTHIAEAVAQPRNRLSQSSGASSIRDVLSTHLNDTTRLIKRARTPRSCAPYQLQLTATKKPRANLEDDADPDEAQGKPRDTGDPTVYDDADFYSVLLTTLLEQKSSSAIGPRGPNDGLSADLRNLNGYQIRREAKTKRVLDTKASKGRKLRYTVHEKLMNFCAPEDRGTWEERQIDDLFSGLLGRRVQLESESEGEMGDDGWTGVPEPERGLLFGR